MQSKIEFSNGKPFQVTPNGWKVVWEVFHYDDEENEVSDGLFVDAKNAAEYCVMNRCNGVSMRLYRPDWHFTTKD